VLRTSLLSHGAPRTSTLISMIAPGKRGFGLTDCRISPRCSIRPASPCILTIGQQPIPARLSPYRRYQIPEYLPRLRYRSGHDPALILRIRRRQRIEDLGAQPPEHLGSSHCPEQSTEPR